MRKYFSKGTQLQKLVSPKRLREKFTRQIKIEHNITEEEGVFRPKQHPRHFDSADSNIVSYAKPIRALSPFNRVPNYAVNFEEPDFDSPEDAKCASVSLLGAPNAGKSTLLNCIVGKKVSAVSPKSHTTSEILEGVYTDVENRVQLVINDTPGAVKSSRRYNSRHILTKSWSVLADTEQAVFIADSTKRLDFLLKEAIKRFLTHKQSRKAREFFRRIDESSSHVDFQRLMKELDEISTEDKEGDLNMQPIPSVLVMNKIDLVDNKRKFYRIQQEIEECGMFDKVFHISATTGFGVGGLVDYLKDAATKKPFKYHPSVSAAQSEVEKIVNTVQSHLFTYTNQEIPYESVVKVREYVPKSNGLLQIGIEIEVRTVNQLRIIKGRQGLVIKRIKELTERDLKMLFNKPVKCVFEIVVIKRPSKLQNLTEEMHKSI